MVSSFVLLSQGILWFQPIFLQKGEGGLCYCGFSFHRRPIERVKLVFPPSDIGHTASILLRQSGRGVCAFGNNASKGRCKLVFPWCLRHWFGCAASQFAASRWTFFPATFLATCLRPLVHSCSRWRHVGVFHVSSVSCPATYFAFRRAEQVGVRSWYGDMGFVENISPKQNSILFL